MDRIEPHGELHLIRIGVKGGQTTMAVSGLDLILEKELEVILWKNRDLFAWAAIDMPDIHPLIMTHRLTLFKEAKPVAQKKRRSGAKKATTINNEVKKLKEIGFIHEVT